MLLGGCSAAESGPAVVRVTEEVLLESPLRLGVNLGQTTYYNDQQYVTNAFAHGGFSRGRQVLLIQTAADSDGKRVTDSYADPSDPSRIYADSFAGGEYYVATGPRAGEQGAILAHEAGTGLFELEHDGTAFGEGEVLWLYGPWVDRARPESEDPNVERSIGIGDFRVKADEGVILDFVETDSAARDQAIRVQFPAHDARLSGGVKHYIQATPNTTYRVRVRARSALSGATIGISMMNYGIPGGEPGHSVPFFAQDSNALSDAWQEYVFEGSTYPDERIGERFSELTIGVAADVSKAQGGEAYIDSIALEDEKLGTASGFSKEVVDALREAQCGSLRFYGTADLGSLVDSFTSGSTTESSWSFLSLASFYRFSTTSSVLDQWLALSKEVDAAPWVTVGSGNTPEQWYNLVSYLAAPGDTDEYSQRRVANGRPQPWTDDFEPIYLEIGNEWWNAIFRPFYIWPPEKYGELCNSIIARIRAHPHFDPDKIKIVVGGWAINAHHWNGIVDATVEEYDYLSVAPYLLHELDYYETTSEKYRSLFASVDAYSAEGGTSTLEDLQENGSDAQLAVYELNTHLTGGTAPASVASEIATSAAAGIAVLDQAMALMAEMKATPINYFTLLQRAFGQDNNRRTGLWGTLVRDESGELRPRPVWQGLRLANQHLIAGNMTRVEISGSPVWKQEANGGVPAMDAVPALHAYAFVKSEEGKRQVNLLLVNRDVERPLRATIDLPFTPAAEAKQIVMTSGHPSDNNEEALKVKLNETELTDVASGDVVTVAPVTAMVLQYRER